MIQSKSSLFTKFRNLTSKYPVTRGMLSYSIMWPTSSYLQEYIEYGTTIRNADWARAIRFGIFGSLFIAPGWHIWMRLMSKLYPKKNLATAVKRAAIDQVTYSPAALAFFFFGLSAMEMKSFKECVDEVRNKFWPTYKLGAVYWPTVQTANFYLVPEKNRTVFVSIASCIWTVYMAHVKAEK